MARKKKSVSKVPQAIAASGLTIYDSLANRPDLWLDQDSLQSLLQVGLEGLNLDYPLRTRSKVVKSAVREVLGYPIPTKFARSKPRFPGQDFDTYVQKSDNLQIWNEEVTPARRYVVIRVDEMNRVTKVRVVTGEVLAKFDSTGTLTQKFQARSRGPVSQSHLVSVSDTATFQKLADVIDSEAGDALIPVASLFERLKRLVGRTLDHVDLDQERNRGAVLHELVAKAIGLYEFNDTGQFPDIPEQLIEIKLQTASTIDLGLVCPDDTRPLVCLPQLRHCDVRYAVFFGTVSGDTVILNHLVLATGEDFFQFFRRFEGKVTNKKIQLKLPSNFFD